MSDSSNSLKVAPRDPNDLHARVSVLEERADNQEKSSTAAQETADKAVLEANRANNRMAYVFGVGAGIGAAAALILWLLDKLLK